LTPQPSEPPGDGRLAPPKTHRRNDTMLYIVRVYEDGQCYEYEYGLLEHATLNFQSEKCCVQLLEYRSGKEKLLASKNENKE
jgi:hypothetical protein